MAALFADPKFLVTLVTLACQFLGQKGLHEDPATVTSVLSPLYLWILAHAHVQNGGAPVPATAPTNTQAGFFRLPLAIALTVFAAFAVLVSSCTPAQKADVKYAGICTIEDATKIGAIMDRTDIGYVEKLIDIAVQVGPDVSACVLAQAKTAQAALVKPAAGSGAASAK